MKTLANVIDIEPATRSISTLPGNVCLRCSDGLLIAYEVARQFESHLLRQRVIANRCSVDRDDDRRIEPEEIASRSPATRSAGQRGKLAVLFI